MTTEAIPFAEPVDPDLERAFLAAAVRAPADLDQVTIRASDFTLGRHRVIYGAIVAARDRGDICSIETLSRILTAHERGPEAAAYLRELVDHPANLGVVRYAFELRELSFRRALLELGSKATELGRLESLEQTASDRFRTIEDAVYRLGAGSDQASQSRPASEWASSVRARIDRARSAGGLPGMPCGIVEIDRVTGGFEPEQLIIIGGRPGMGKSTLACNIIDNMAVNNGRKVFFAELEMSAEQTLARMASARSGVPYSQIRSGDITFVDEERIENALLDFGQAQLEIDPRPARTLSELRSSVRRAASRMGGLDVIAIDYLQLMRVESRKGYQSNRTSDVTEISQGLKGLAKEFRVPVIALAQLSRQVENRDDKRPILADLRESGSIEQDADVVMFVYRDEYYLKNTNPKEDDPSYLDWQAKLMAAKGKAEVIFAKVRDGEAQSVELRYDAPILRFSGI